MCDGRGQAQTALYKQMGYKKIAHKHKVAPVWQLLSVPSYFHVFYGFLAKIKCQITSSSNIIDPTFGDPSGHLKPPKCVFLSPK